MNDRPTLQQSERLRELLDGTLASATGLVRGVRAVGILRGFAAQERRAAAALRAQLVSAGCAVTEITPVPDADDRRGAGHGDPCDLLIDIRSNPSPWALRQAAANDAPLIAHPQLTLAASGRSLTTARHDVLELLFSDDSHDVAVQEFTLRPDQPDSTVATLTLDGGRPLPCDGVQVRISSLPGEQLQITIAERTVHTARTVCHHTTWGRTTVEIDGTPVRTAHGDVRVSVLPGRLRTLTAA
jgi:hypothetical protein